MVFGNTKASIEAFRSSSTKVAMRSPFFVYRRWSSVITPPITLTPPPLPSNPLAAMASGS